jgi:hypothetical protein
LPPSRPTLATTHPELACLGEAIIAEITEVLDIGSGNRDGDFSAAIAQLPDLLKKVMEFVGTALATRRSYDNVAHWVE